jgi:hypothetical protein
LIGYGEGNLYERAIRSTHHNLSFPIDKIDPLPKSDFLQSYAFLGGPGRSENGFVLSPNNTDSDESYANADNSENKIHPIESIL